VLVTVLFILFICCIAVQWLYALFLFTRIFRLYTPSVSSVGELKKVTVLICAKNEAHHLQQFLPDILSQKFEDNKGNFLYEVLVVNDASEDATETVLQTLQQEYAHLRYISITPEEPRLFKGKKFALSKGMEAAQHEIILLTDADCKPSSSYWLPQMIAPILNGKEIICGYGAYNLQSGFLNTFIRWETMHSFLQYASYTMAGMPYMAVGRNLCCTKSLFLNAQQSAIWNALPSGDDDLLMQVSATKSNTDIVLNRQAFTYSEPKTTWKTWWLQKQRHLSTGKYYKPGIKKLLGIYAVSHALSWVLFLVLPFFTKDWALIVFIFSMRCALYWFIWKFTAIKLREKKLLRNMVFCDIGWAFYNLLLSPYIFFKNKQRWK